MPAAVEVSIGCSVARSGNVPSTIASDNRRMRTLAVLAIMIGGFALIDHFALDGRTARQVERDAKQTAMTLRVRAPAWTDQFSR